MTQRRPKDTTKAPLWKRALRGFVTLTGTVSVIAIAAGAGIGFLTQATARRLPDLVEVHAPRPEWVAPLWLVTHVDLHRTTKVQALLKFIKDHVRDHTW